MDEVRVSETPPRPLGERIDSRVVENGTEEIVRRGTQVGTAVTLCGWGGIKGMVRGFGRGVADVRKRLKEPRQS